MNKLLYVSQGGANDAAGDFGIWPIERFRGAANITTNDTSLGLYFNSGKKIEQGGGGYSAVDLADITVTTGENQLAVLQDLVRAINFQRTRMVVVADDNTAGTARGQEKVSTSIDLGTAPAITYGA